jgi:fibronectin-binding autotransporter adhesin
MQKITKKINKKMSNYFQTSSVSRERGVAMMVAIIFFVVVSTLIVVGLTGPSAREFSLVNGTVASRQSYFLAESGTEDAYYRIKNSMTISTTTTLVLGSSIATTTVSTLSGGHQKDITSIGNLYSNQRSVSFSTITGAGVAFNYGIQGGPGGVTVNGGSTINGNVYSNGDVNAISATINGSVVAADTGTQVLDQSNITPSTPTSSTTFRNASGSQDFAQSFQVSDTLPVSKISLYLKKVGSPADITVRLVADNSGSPSTVTLPIGTVTIPATSIGTSYAWIDITFNSSDTSLIPNTTYWLVLDNSTQSTSNYYVIGANADSSYTSGTVKTGSYSGSWTAQSQDSYFQIYIGGTTSLIGGATYSGGLVAGTTSGGHDVVWATTVKGTNTIGSLYCTTGTNNSKSCNTTHGVAPQVDMPFTDSDIAAWKATASSGTVITGSTSCHGGYSGGNCIVDWANGTFGPGVITGNLTVNGGGTLTLTGTLWVKGTITITGGGKIRLPSGYALNSETIISDNIVNINGGGSLGSGTTGSYLFIVSTSLCPYASYCSGSPAITVSGGAGAIAVDAQYGNVTLQGGCTLNAAVGNTMTVTGGSTLDYDSGLASPSFSSGPSGSWTLSKWKEI